MSLLSGLMRVVLAILLGVSALMTFASGFAAFRYLALASRCRKPGVSRLSGMLFHNSLFRPQLYTEEGNRYFRLYWWATFATGAFLALDIVFGKLLAMWD